MDLDKILKKLEHLLIIAFGWVRYLFCQNKQLVSYIKMNGLTYLSYGKLCDISKFLQQENKNAFGIIIEAGCGAGGSALLIAKNKKISQKFLLFDTFQGMPAPSRKDSQDSHKRYNIIISGRAIGIAGNNYYGYEKNLLSKIKDLFVANGLDIEQNNISFHKGLFTDTMCINQPVFFAHVDCDWYESTYFCLEQIFPYLQVGGAIVVDDYYSYDGCKKAVDDFLKERNIDKKQYRILKKEAFWITRVF